MFTNVPECSPKSLNSFIQSISWPGKIKFSRIPWNSSRCRSDWRKCLVSYGWGFNWVTETNIIRQETGFYYLPCILVITNYIQTLKRKFTISIFLPPAYVVRREGYVLTRVCLSVHRGGYSAGGGTQVCLSVHTGLLSQEGVLSQGGTQPGGVLSQGGYSARRGYSAGGTRLRGTQPGATQPGEVPS